LRKAGRKKGKNGAESLLPGEFRFSRTRIIIIFHSFIPLPLGDIVLLPRAGGSPGLMRLGDKLSSLAWRGRYQSATMELQLDCSSSVITQRHGRVRRCLSFSRPYSV